MTTTLQWVISGMEGAQVAFLLLHDWVPLPPFSDVKALRRVEPISKIVLATLVSSLPFVLGLVFSLRHVKDARWPQWVQTYLLVSYGWLLIGELEAWWVPYLWRPQPERAERYRKLFGATHAWLPERNGIVPNTLHTGLHLVTLATVLLLGWKSLVHG